MLLAMKIRSSCFCREMSSVSTLLSACSIADLCFLLPYCSSAIALCSSPLFMIAFPIALLFWLKTVSISVISCSFSGRRSLLFFLSMAFVHFLHAHGEYPVFSGMSASMACICADRGLSLLIALKCPKWSPGCNYVRSFIFAHPF